MEKKQVMVLHIGRTVTTQLLIVRVVISELKLLKTLIFLIFLHFYAFPKFSTARLLYNKHSKIVNVEEI